MAENWSASEVEAAVEDYFNMLRRELTGQQVNKSEHRRALIEHLKNRSEGSVELKHQNISAVLIEMGIPYIDGYKPRFNYQRSLLPAAISEYLTYNTEIHALFQSDTEVAPEVPSVEDILHSLEEPPIAEPKGESNISETPVIQNPTRVNYLEREARNQSLGDAGEQFVINYERARLIHSGKESLSEKIDQVSATVGPTAGYDIRSYNVDGTDRFIEAKTTKYGKSTPFFVTPNELEFSSKNARHYFLYRVFKFRAKPGVFTLPGHLEKQCLLMPSQYIARMA